MPDVLLPCGHMATVVHDRGERLVFCQADGIEHIVTAAHTDETTYSARRRHPEPVAEEERSTGGDGAFAIQLADGARLVDLDPVRGDA